MKFIDEAIITVQSGDGGRGCVSFRRERFIPKGGPDGGDGGKGGDIILRATTGKRTLDQFRFKRNFKAQNGAPGQGRQKTGRGGADLTIEIPPGTLVTDLDSGAVLKDFTHPEDALVVARGGRGGQGNTRFKSSTHRTPRFAQPGESGQALTLKLDLKLLADVGIIGLPNAGKSTLIRAISSATPKIGDYPFTTLTPTLGVVRAPRREPFVVADIPGLIEGAHRGAGLGIRFLRHIERTGILIHLVDAANLDPDNLLAGYETVNRELAAFNPRLMEKPQLLVLNKIDLSVAADAAARFKRALKREGILTISAATGKGLKELIDAVSAQLDASDAEKGNGGS